MSSGLYNTHKIDFDTTLDLTRLKPYGDTMNDGKVQTSFTLPIKDDERGEEAARQIAKKMGLEEPNVAYHAPLDKEFTFYVVYGSCVHSVNYEDIHVITVESDVMSMEDTNDYIREHTPYADIDEFAAALCSGETSFADLVEIKPVLRLHPPRKGFKTIKRTFQQGGALGYYGPRINDLLYRMR